MSDETRVVIGYTLLAVGFASLSLAAHLYVKWFILEKNDV